MDIRRSKSQTPRLSALATDLNDLRGPCIGCTDCTGLCEALVEALVVPDMVLTKRRDEE